MTASTVTTTTKGLDPQALFAAMVAQGLSEAVAREQVSLVESAIASEAKAVAEALALDEAVAFSKQATFNVRGQQMTIAQVAYTTLNDRLSAPQRAKCIAATTLEVELPEGSTERQHVVFEAWKVLKTVQKGYKAQGLEFSITAQARQALVDQALGL